MSDCISIPNVSDLERTIGIVRTQDAGVDETVDLKLARADYVLLVALMGIAFAIIFVFRHRISPFMTFSAELEFGRAHNGVKQFTQITLCIW